MSAGTITLTNGSAVVGGSGTTFTTELAAGDFIVSTVGGVPYTLPVKSVESNTQLTLVSNYNGPTQSGAAWSAIPRVALNMVTAALVAQSAEALRGLNYDKQNWQQVFSAAGNITVKLPDGTTFTGPSWKYLVDNTGTIDGKKGGTLSTTYLSVAPYDTGAGNKVALQSFSTGSVAGIIGRTSYSYFNDTGYVGARRGSGYDILDIAIGIDKANGTYTNWVFSAGGNATANNGSWINNSDERIKENIKQIENPLAKMRLVRGCTWDRLDNAPPGQGFIAQELALAMPTAVFEGGETELRDGSIVEKTLAVDVAGAAAALHHEAILVLMDQIEDLKEQVAALQPGS